MSGSLSSNTPLLDSILSPRDLKLLTLKELDSLCEELREELISTVSRVGGHFASSLGVVELTVALHYVFDSPKDRFVWDVGHQAYIHKILTGRRKELPRIRRLGGISGFPKRSESPYDAFGVGHAGTSVSAAIGMVEAFGHRFPDNQDRHVVAVIGDGAMTCGSALEAFNHSGQLHKNLIVVLNDNGMSIAPNVGAMSRALSKTLTGEFSTAARRRFKRLVQRGFIPHSVYRTLDRAEEATQGFLSDPAMLFGALGFRYIGPVDGHSTSGVVDALLRAKRQDGPVLLHVLSKKGKGYSPAEVDPVRFHGVTPFSIEDGSPRRSSKPVLPSYTQIFGSTLLEFAKQDERVVGITAAMPDGTGLNKLAEEMPERFYDVGICEQHAVTFAAGLACEGMRPFCAIYSTFLQRAYDQVLHDVCLQSLPVRFAIDRGGLVGEDGPTHHGVFDFAYLRMLPNMVLMAPRDEAEFRNMMAAAREYDKGPIAFRYPRGTGSGADISRAPSAIEIGKAEVLHQGECPRALLIGIGSTALTCLEASRQLLEQHGIESTVVNARFVKPLDTALFGELIRSHPLTVTVEDHVLQGGFGSAVLEFMSEAGLAAQSKLIRLGIGDFFVEHGANSQLQRICGIDADSIIQAVKTHADSSVFFKPRLVEDSRKSASNE